MELSTILSVSAAFLSIISVAISYRKIQKQKKQERELLKKLEKKSSKYLNELIRHLEKGHSIHTIDEIEGNLTEIEMLKRNELFEKYIMKILQDNQESKFSEIRDALYLEEKINKFYLEKMHKRLVNRTKAHNKL